MRPAPDPPHPKVYLGLTDVIKLEKAQAYDVEAIVVHPGWELSSMVTPPCPPPCLAPQDNNILGGHDIALIKLSREVLLSDTAWPACLPGTRLPAWQPHTEPGCPRPAPDPGPGGGRRRGHRRRLRSDQHHHTRNRKTHFED